MKTYILQRVVSILLVVLLWFSAGSVGEGPTESWRIILLLTVIFGMTHYFVGGFYQLKSLMRSDSSPRLLSWFAGLAAVSVASYFFFSWAGWLSFLSVALIFYFLLHGYFNEITLFEKQVNKKAEPKYIAVVILFLLGVTCLGVGHASWFFNQSYEYTSYVLYTAHVTPLFWLGGLLLAAALCLHAWCVLSAKQHRAVLAGTFFVLSALSYGAILIAPVNYVFILSWLLAYNFFIWFIFYAQKFWSVDKREFFKYITLHLVVLLPLLTVFFGVSPGILIVHGSVFIPITIAHISTSFLSEKWFLKFVLPND